MKTSATTVLMLSSKDNELLRQILEVEISRLHYELFELRDTVANQNKRNDLIEEKAAVRNVLNQLEKIEQLTSLKD